MGSAAQIPGGTTDERLVAIGLVRSGAGRTSNAILCTAQAARFTSGDLASEERAKLALQFTRKRMRRSTLAWRKQRLKTLSLRNPQVRRCEGRGRRARGGDYALPPRRAARVRDGPAGTGSAAGAASLLRRTTTGKRRDADRFRDRILSRAVERANSPARRKGCRRSRRSRRTLHGAPGGPSPRWWAVTPNGLPRRSATAARRSPSRSRGRSLAAPTSTSTGMGGDAVCRRAKESLIVTSPPQPCPAT